MLGPLMSLGSDAIDLLDVRARLLLRELEQAGVRIAIYAAAALLGVVGILAIISGATVWVAQYIGSASALACLGGVLVLVALVTYVIVRLRVGRSSRPTIEELEQRAKELRRSLADFNSEDDKDKKTVPGIAALASSTLKKVVENPETAAGGLFALAALLGPGRVLRTAGQLAAAAGVLSSLIKIVVSAHESLQTFAKGQDESPRKPHAENGVGRGVSGSGAQRSTPHHAAATAPPRTRPIRHTTEGA